MDSQERKKQLRQQLIQKRRSLEPSQWRTYSDRLCDNLTNSSFYAKANTILAYFSFRNEPDLSPLFEDSSKIWGFPICVGDRLTWHRWQPGDPQVKGRYGILTPAETAPTIDPESVDLILVPAVACDQRGYRLGYGGGFYDRLFAEPPWNTIPSLGIIFDFAYLDHLPADSWDSPLSGVCTDANFYATSSN
ncbi:5-formyltetrahydrofolate cyclo-ligase [Geitlerinema sp. PCC 9228]|jgi:5-formyltetrahydrofolate cyclo-ligase|uniref:5-formyltetrahydrofolate cyclo-ligase n=1 Tax=Geitlerinema sp. PCC 9228 TaxID=111611 RepID=UPI0008F9B5F5|nr:5-formyltetrahydrofolate cyclo-ligase [Geitlerinema sp. PCC 9228]